MLKLSLVAVALLFLGCAGSPVKEAGEDDVFIIERTVPADIKTAYEVWVNPDLFKLWLGPTGASMYFLSVGVKEGGTSQWSMTTSDGKTKFGQLHYKTIQPPHLLVYTQNFCDKDGKPARLPIAAPYPEQLQTTVTLIEEAPKKTRVTVRWDVIGKATEEERKTFRDMRPIMTTGWSQSFDKLNALLKPKK